MASNVKVDIPASPVAYTRDVRKNFEIIKQELEALQLAVFSTDSTNAPVFTGLATLESMVLSGNLDLSTLGMTVTYPHTTVTMNAAFNAATEQGNTFGASYVLTRIGQIVLFNFNFTANTAWGGGICTVPTDWAPAFDTYFNGVRDAAGTVSNSLLRMAPISGILSFLPGYSIANLDRLMGNLWWWSAT